MNPLFEPLTVSSFPASSSASTTSASGNPAAVGVMKTGSATISQMWRSLPSPTRLPGSTLTSVWILKRSANPIPTNDAWIAALALQYDLPVLSNDTHFDRVDRIERIAF